MRCYCIAEGVLRLQDTKSILLRLPDRRVGFSNCKSEWRPTATMRIACARDSIIDSARLRGVQSWRLLGTGCKARDERGVDYNCSPHLCSFHAVASLAGVLSGIPTFTSQRCRASMPGARRKSIFDTDREGSPVSGSRRHDIFQQDVHSSCKGDQWGGDALVHDTRRALRGT